MTKRSRKEISNLTSVPKAVKEVALPTIFCQVIILVYGISDIFYLGRTGNPYMIAGVSLIFPVLNIFLALAGVIGIGTGALVGKLSGEKKIGEIRKASFFGVYFSIASAAVFSIIMFVFMGPILGFLGARGDTFLYGRQYALCVIVFGGIPIAVSSVLSNLIRSIGALKVAVFGIVLGSLLNVVLDPVCMFWILPQGCEVLGAGIATLISNCIGCGFFLYIAFIVKGKLSGVLKAGNEMPEKKNISAILRVAILPAAVLIFFGVVRWAVFNIPIMFFPERAGKMDIIWPQVCVDTLMVALSFSTYYICVHGYSEVTSIEDIKRKSWQYAGLLVCVIFFPISATLLVRDLEQAYHEKEANHLIQQARDEALLLSEGETEEKKEGEEAQQEEEKEQEEAESGTQSYKELEEELPILAQYEGLWEQNHDLAGWLRIEDTAIDYPVMYTPDDPEYYLHRAFDGSEASSGSLFIGEKCMPRAPHVIVYGHHMKNGTMFGALPQYADAEYAKKHPVICYDTLYEEKKYEVVAAFYSKIYPENTKEEVFRYYWYTDLSREEVFDQYIKKVKEKALYDTGVGTEFGDEILTLSTCSYHTDDGRFVVVARRKREAQN
ncbi:MATE family efflux transporter [Parablautia intestinalis]|nr:MATE family efflux transporter [Parablautia intestinalis]